VPALLTPGEYVLTRQQTHSLLPMLAALETGQRVHHFARGGPVASFPVLPEGQLEIILRGVKEILDPVRDFLGDVGETGDQIQQLRDTYRELVDQVTRGRFALEREGHNVDTLLERLATALPEKISEAVEQSLSGIVSARDSVRDTLSDLLTGSASPLSDFEKIALLETRQAEIDRQLSTASDTALPGLIQDLSSNLQEQLGLSPFDLSSREYLAQFESVTQRLAGLQGTLDSRINEVYAAAGVEPAAMQSAQTIDNSMTITIPLSFHGDAGSATDRAQFASWLVSEWETGVLGKAMRREQERRG
ncbi:MAG: hypothetical protein ACRDRT_09450, partial [Pseudonocardiaceae bacterium]